MAGIQEILTFYELLRATIDSLERIKDIVGDGPIDVEDLIQGIDNSEFNYGTKIRAKGMHSDFVPVARDLVTNVPEYSTEFLLDPLPSKPFYVEGYRCASLQPMNSKFAGNPRCLPVFYEPQTERPMDEYLTGEHVIIDGEIIEIPEKWESFIDIEQPAGILANRILKVGEFENNLGLLPWKIIRDRDIELEVGGGQFLMADDIWMLTTRTNHDRVLLVNGWGRIMRHGGYEETAENIQELYLPNFRNDDLFTGVTDHLSERGAEKPIDAQWDMSRLSPEQTRWLREKIS